MILDPYIVKATTGITSKQIISAFAKIYPEYNNSSSLNEYKAEVEDWLINLRKKPGLALSTGRRNSKRGMLTCSLLDVLGVAHPKAERNRMDLAWAILDSPGGSKSIGYVPELEAEERPHNKSAKQ